MNQIQVQAQIDALVDQRNAALNTVVNLQGEIALLKAEIAELKKPQIEGAEDA